MFNLEVSDLIQEAASLAPGAGSNDTNDNSGDSNNNNGSSSDESEEDQLATASEFSISFDGNGDQQTFYFSLLPAVDDGNETTDIPEIKPGILKKTNMQVKRFQIPGGSSVFQMVGVRETILQCVGLIIGNEGFNSSEEANAVDAYDPNSSLNAYKSALEFDREVVQRGSRCKINITSVKGESEDAVKETSIKHNCFIQNYRYFSNRADRVWFSLDVIILDYTAGGTKYQETVETQDSTDVNVKEDKGEVNFDEDDPFGIPGNIEQIVDESAVEAENSGDESDDQDSSGNTTSPRSGSAF